LKDPEIDDTAFHRARKITLSGRDSVIAVAMFRTFLNDKNARMTHLARQLLATTAGERFSEVGCYCDGLPWARWGHVHGLPSTRWVWRCPNCERSIRKCEAECGAQQILRIRGI